MAERSLGHPHPADKSESSRLPNPAPETATSPEVALPQKVVQHLQELARKGPVRVDDPRHGAIHGTSLETVLHIIREGTLPGATAHISERYEHGDISVFPTTQMEDVAGNLPNAEHILRGMHEDKSLRETKGYAGDSARDHALLTLLGFPLDDDQAWEAARDSYLDDDTTFFSDSGRSEEEIEAAIQTAETRKGFLLGISPEVQNTEGLTIMEGDNHGYWDMRIRTGEKGLSFELLSGIEPLGEVEWRFLEDIRTAEDLEQTLDQWSGKLGSEIGHKKTIGNDIHRREVSARVGKEKVYIPELIRLWGTLSTVQLARLFDVTPAKIGEYGRMLRAEGVALPDKRMVKYNPTITGRRKFIEDNINFLTPQEMARILGETYDTVISERARIKEKLGIPKESEGKPPEAKIAARRQKEIQLLGAGFTAKEAAKILNIAVTRIYNGIQLLSYQEREALGIKPGKRTPTEEDWNRRAQAVADLHLPPQVAAERLGVPVELLTVKPIEMKPGEEVNLGTEDADDDEPVLGQSSQASIGEQEAQSQELQAFNGKEKRKSK